jgi:lipopolysaccharide/colanic/teichoic acid biosynthesis glycosyltransferase
MLFFHEMGMKNIPNYTKRLLVKPGITGWAQTMYKRSDTLDEYRMKTGYDLSFILDYSVSAYFKSILYTVDTLIYRKG